MNTNPYEREYVPDRTIPVKKLLDEFSLCHKFEPRTEHCFKKTIDRFDEFLPNATNADVVRKNVYNFQNWLTSRYARPYINRMIDKIRQVIKWAVLVDLASEAQSYGLSLIPDLKEGDKRCRENPPRTPVPREHIESVLPFLAPMYAVILWIRYRLGLRPSEACGLRSCDIIFNWENGTWLYAPENHKTAHHGNEKPSIFDKECQEILEPYLPNDRNSTEPIFRNQNGNAVNPNEYGRKIKRAIDKNGLPKFVLYQARYTACTEISAEFGRPFAQAFLGHSTEQMTKHYDGNRFDKNVLDKLQKIADSRNAQAAQGTPNPDPPPVSFAVELPETYENRPKLRIVKGA